MLLEGEHWEPLARGISVIVSDSHRFNTDTILLAWFSRPRRGEVCADLGTGCGAIPLLWCARAEPGKIYAVELQADACGMLRRSAERNGLSGRIEAVHGDIRALGDRGAPVPRGLDRVACNPPYKAVGTGAESPREERRLARHEAACRFDEAAAAAAALLRWGGRFCCCLRPERLCDAVTALRAAGLEPKRLRFVQQRPEKAPFLFLLEAARGGRPGLRAEPVLLLEDGAGKPSAEAAEIYGDYGEEPV